MVPSGIPNDSYFPEEQELRSIVVDGLEQATDDVILDGWRNSRRELTETEREKLIYFAIKEFDLPLTYSWYLAGSKTLTGPTTDDSQGPVTAPSPSASSESEQEYTVHQFKRYFRSTTFFDDYDLEEVFFTNKFEFLCDFYEAEADDQWADLYIQSTRLREKLNSLEDTVESNDEYESLSQWTNGSEEPVLSRVEERKIRDSISKLHMELARLDEEFQIARRSFVQGTDVIEKVLAKLANESSLDGRQKVLVKGLEDFFYDYVWKYPALLISTRTATGPHEGYLRDSQQEKYEDFSRHLQQRIDKLTQLHHREGLQPEPSDFTIETNEEATEAIAELTHETVKPSSNG